MGISNLISSTRHPALFYRCRSEFVTHIVHSLSRIGLLPNSSSENRRLAVDLVELVLTWEQQRLNTNKPESFTSEEQDSHEQRPHQHQTSKHDGAYLPTLILIDT